MTLRAGTWAFGLIGSVTAHGGIALLLLISIQPEPVTEQPMPPSELEVQAYQLDRSQAREQQPQSQQTKADTPDGTALDAGAIPQTRAKPAQAVAKPLSVEVVPTPAAVEARQPRILAPQVTASAASMPEVKPTTAQITAQRQALPKIAAAVVTPVILTQAKTPTFAPLAAVIRSQSALPVAMPAVATAPQKVEAAQVQPATPSAQKLKAALAFSGAEGDVDPLSIAAFQSFMMPGDAVAEGDRLRDGVEGLLAQVPCSRMQVVFDPDTATLQVVGHIPDKELRAPVLAALRAQMGANITVSDNILILPRPQCGALSGIAEVGLAQSTDQITNPLVIGEDAQARVFSFTQGDLLSLDMTAPDYDAYIYFDYFSADGNVLHIQPNQYTPLRLTEAKSTQEIGAKSAEDGRLQLVIGPPYGQEIGVAFAASEPLYEGLRPIQEPAAEYLIWLKEQVRKARAGNPDFKGEWVYFFVATRER